MAAPPEIVGEEAFDGRRLRRDGVWAVAFAADWCPFCTSFLMRFARLAPRHPQLLIGNVTDEESPLWERFQIEVVPTVVVFVDGQLQDRFDGVSGVGLTEESVDAIAEALKLRGAGRLRSARPRRGG